MPNHLPVFTSLVVGVYALVLFVLMLYGLHRYWIVFLYWKLHKHQSSFKNNYTYSSSDPLDWPIVTIQLPVFNERYVVQRLINAVCDMDYPREKMEIQIIDDSTDETVDLVATETALRREQGFDIHHLRRKTRAGFKAGALAFGLKKSRGEFVAIFDADFLPPKAFLKATLPHFRDASVGMVQTRWGHINANYSLLTRLQALFLDGHFLLEHTARFKSGALFNFNGTAGIWRKKSIESAGGWSARTLTEDLDLSYRAQLAGWKFIYDPDFVCPAELPVDIYAFFSQQRRWTKGALQVAKFLLKELWRSPRLTLHAKVEATVHLTGNIGYLLTVVVAVLLLPSLYLRNEFSWSLSALELIIFIATTVSITFFYAISQRELYPDWRWRTRDIPILLSFGIGMCLSNARAVLEGLWGKNSDFVRTPKYNIQNAKDDWLKKAYAKSNNGSWVLYVVFAAYSFATLALAAYYDQWAAFPFILMFVFGFCYVTGLCLKHRSARG